MKKYISLFLIVAVIIAVFPIPAATVLADDDDFEISYQFNPEIVGYMGAQVQLLVTVKNLSSATKDITDVDVIINTDPAFSERWTPHPVIVPGHQRTVSFTVTFSAGDVNEQKILQVAIYRPGKTNPSGYKMFNFEIEGKEEIFDVSHSLSGDDTITVSHEFTNTIETHAALNVQTRVSMFVGGENVYTGPVENHGTVFPGASFHTSFHYTFGEDEYGVVDITYQIACTIVGAGYSYEESWSVLRPAPPPPEISFNATLYAEPIEIDAGGEVTLRIAIGNTGDDAIEMFEVLNSEDEVVANTESLPAGGAGSVTFTERFYETTTVSYLVAGHTGEYAVAHETNAMTITVREPEPTVSETPEASASPPVETQTMAAVTQEPEPSASEDAEAVSEDGATGSSDMLYIIIIALAVLVLAGISILILILKKKNKDPK